MYKPVVSTRYRMCRIGTDRVIVRKMGNAYNDGMFAEYIMEYFLSDNRIKEISGILSAVTAGILAFALLLAAWNPGNLAAARTASAVGACGMAGICLSEAKADAYSEPVSVSMRLKDRAAAGMAGRFRRRRMAELSESFPELVSAARVPAAEPSAVVRTEGTLSFPEYAAGAAYDRDEAFSDTGKAEAAEIPEAGASEEKEKSSEQAYVVVGKGFLCDGSGRIVGCREGFTVTDGLLALPADAFCTGIARGAFAALGDEIEEIYIPANIRTIEDGAFDGLSELVYIEVHPDNPFYESRNGYLFQKNQEN